MVWLFPISQFQFHILLWSFCIRKVRGFRFSQPGIFLTCTISFHEKVRGFREGVNICPTRQLSDLHHLRGSDDSDRPEHRRPDQWAGTVWYPSASLSHFFCFVFDQRAGFPQFPTFFVSLSNIISQYDAYLPLSLTLTLTGKWPTFFRPSQTTWARWNFESF